MEHHSRLLGSHDAVNELSIYKAPDESPLGLVLGRLYSWTKETVLTLKRLHYYASVYEPFCFQLPFIVAVHYFCFRYIVSVDSLVTESAWSKIFDQPAGSDMCKCRFYYFHVRSNEREVGANARLPNPPA